MVVQTFGSRLRKRQNLGLHGVQGDMLVEERDRYKCICREQMQMQMTDEAMTIEMHAFTDNEGKFKDD